jgi:hypothetical protein
MSVIDINKDGLLYATAWFLCCFDLSRSLSFTRRTDPTELVDGYKQPSSADVASYENDEKSTFVLTWRQDARPA